MSQPLCSKTQRGQAWRGGGRREPPKSSWSPWFSAFPGSVCSMTALPSQVYPLTPQETPQKQAQSSPFPRCILWGPTACQLPGVPPTPSFPSAGVRNSHSISVELGSETPGESVMLCPPHCHAPKVQRLLPCRQGEWCCLCREHRWFFSSCSQGEFPQSTDNCAKGKPSEAQGTVTPRIDFGPILAG